MADAAIGPLFSYLGWAFLPNYATSFLQTFYYRLVIPAGQVHPRPGTAPFARDHRRIRLFVLSTYLLYTLAQTLYDIKVASDFYVLLGVGPSSTEREIRSRFRRLAAKYHPDKLNTNANSNINTESLRDAANNDADLHFLTLKLAQDTLLSPPLRYAYNHFGPQVTMIQMPQMKSISSYVYAGLRQKVPEFSSSVISLVVLNYLWLPKWGQFWRYLIIVATTALELYLLTHDISTPPLSSFFPPPSSPIFSPLVTLLSPILSTITSILPIHLLPFQILLLARKMSISLNIFISQLSPPRHASASFFSDDPNFPTPLSSSNELSTTLLRQLKSGLDQLSSLSARTDAEVTDLLRLQLVPFKGDKVLIRELRRGMTEGIVGSAVASHPDVQDAVKTVLLERKRKRRAQQGEAEIRKRRERKEQGRQRRDGAEVVDLLKSDVELI